MTSRRAISDTPHPGKRCVVPSVLFQTDHAFMHSGRKVARSYSFTKSEHAHGRSKNPKKHSRKRFGFVSRSSQTFAVSAQRNAARIVIKDSNRVRPTSPCRSFSNGAGHWARLRGIGFGRGFNGRNQPCRYFACAKSGAGFAESVSFNPRESAAPSRAPFAAGPAGAAGASDSGYSRFA
jgi:hypothetical protein